MVIIMYLLNLLKTEKARKIFGKKELEIIEKQLNGERLTQSEKNRLSRDIRKKLDFINEISEFKDDFKLERNQINKKIIGETVNIILNDELKANIRAILLFGSFADNSFIRRSDIDICVIFKNDLSLKEATKFRIRISGQVSDKIDIQVFNVLSFKIKRSIARNHKVLYNVFDFDNINFSIKYLKDEDYFIRLKYIIKNGKDNR